MPVSHTTDFDDLFDGGAKAAPKRTKASTPRLTLNDALLDDNGVEEMREESAGKRARPAPTTSEAERSTKRARGDEDVSQSKSQGQGATRSKTVLALDSDDDSAERRATKTSAPKTTPRPAAGADVQVRLTGLRVSGVAHDCARRCSQC